MHVPKRLMLPCYEPSIPIYHLCVGEQEAFVFTHPTFLTAVMASLAHRSESNYQLTITPTLETHGPCVSRPHDPAFMVCGVWHSQMEEAACQPFVGEGYHREPLPQPMVGPRCLGSSWHSALTYIAFQFHQLELSRE